MYAACIMQHAKRSSPRAALTQQCTCGSAGSATLVVASLGYHRVCTAPKTEVAAPATMHTVAHVARGLSNAYFSPPHPLNWCSCLHTLSLSYAVSIKPHLGAAWTERGRRRIGGAQAQEPGHHASRYRAWQYVLPLEAVVGHAVACALQLAHHLPPQEIPQLKTNVKAAFCVAQEKTSPKGFGSMPRCGADAAMANNAAHKSTHLRTAYQVEATVVSLPAHFPDALHHHDVARARCRTR